MFDEVINSSDVTLVVNDASLKPDQSVCKFNQTGFCKFGQTCCKMHVNKLCSTPNCDKHMCINRHPNLCRYFSQNGHCKRGQKCAYSHTKSETFVKVEETEKKITLLKSEIESLKANILKSENHLLRAAVEDLRKTVTSNCKHIEDLKEEILNMQQKFSANLKYSCDKCGKTFVSNKNLNIHVNKYHNEEVPKESHHNDILLTENDLKCEYWLCRFKDETSIALEQHIQIKHQIDEAYSYPPSAEWITCGDCGDDFSLDDHFARHSYEDHKYSYTCDHCHKHLPGEDNLFCIHIKQCSVPCDGDPDCPCIGL